MTIGKGVKGSPNPNALHRTGWRPPLIEGKYQDMVFEIMARPDFKNKTTRDVIEAAIELLAAIP